MPPIGARYSGACCSRDLGDARRLVVRTCDPSRARRAPRDSPSISDRAPAAARWHRPASASSPSYRRRCRSHGRDENPGACRAPRERARHRRPQPLDVVGRILPREVRVLRMQQHPLRRRSGNRRRWCRQTRRRRCRRRRREPSSSRNRSLSCTLLSRATAIRDHDTTTQRLRFSSRAVTSCRRAAEPVL